MIIVLSIVAYFLIGCWLTRIWPCYGLTIIAWPYILLLIVCDLPLWRWIADHFLVIATLATIAGFIYYLVK